MVRAIAGSATPYVFGTQQLLKLNDCYEPIASTHQPYGFDQYAALYRRYKVVGVRVRVQCHVPPALGDVVIYAMRLVTPEATVTLTGETVDEVIERPGTIWGLFAQGAAPVTHVINPKMAELCGVSSQQFAADTVSYSAAVGASPARYPALQISCASAVGNATGYFFLHVDYDVEFYERITQAQS